MTQKWNTCISKKKSESGELEFLFRPKHPLDPEQNWEPICSEGEFESPEFFSIHTDFSVENLGICESQLFRKSMFGLKKKLFAHFIFRYNFKDATLEMITLRSSDSDKNGQSEYTTCVRLPPHDTNDKNDS